MSLMLTSCISSIIIMVLLFLNSGTMEYVLSIISITVTCILGITTYQQVDTQLSIDMIEKTPLFSCVFDGDEIIDNKRIAEDKLLNNDLLLFENRKFAYLEALHESKDKALFHLKLKNDSAILIKRVDILYKNENNAQYSKVENYRAKQCINNNPNEPLENLKHICRNYNASSVYSVQPGAVIDTHLCVPLNCRDFDSHIKLEIETVHGYNYEEFIDIFATKAGFMKEKMVLLYLITKSDLSINMIK